MTIFEFMTSRAKSRTMPVSREKVAETDDKKRIYEALESREKVAAERGERESNGEWREEATTRSRSMAAAASSRPTHRR